MMETKTEKYIRESLRYWLNNLGLTQNQASEKFEIPQSTVNKILSGKHGINFKNAELIANGLEITIEEMLRHGKKLLGDDPETEGLTPEQIQALEAFKFCMLEGGETIEMLTKNIIELAEKKRVETDVQNNTLGKMKSA